jgi:branched-chain amino acid transport system permease protein
MSRPAPGGEAHEVGTEVGGDAAGRGREGSGRLLARVRLGAIAGLLLLVATTPWWSSSSTGRVVVDLLILVAVTQVWSYLAGAAGVIALGVYGIAGLGAYALWFLADQGLNPVLAVGGAGLVAGALAVLSAPLVLRLPSALAAVAAWTIGQAAFEIVAHSARLGGDSPAREIAAVVDLGSARDEVVSWLAVVISVGAVAMVYAHRHSLGGMTLVASGDDPDTAHALGLRVRRARRLVWVLAAVITGTAGALSAFRVAQVAPVQFDLSHWTLPVLAVAGIGGVGTLEGPLAAAVLYVLADEVLPGSSGAFQLGAALVGVAGLLWGSDGWWGSLRDRVALPPTPRRRLGR